MGRVLFSVCIASTLFALATACGKTDVSKKQDLKLILSQLRLMVSTRHMKKSLQLMNEVIQFNAELDEMYDSSLRKLNCMVTDFNDQMTNITRSFIHEKSKGKHLKQTIVEQQRELDEKNDQVQDLNYTLHLSQMHVQELDQQILQLQQNVTYSNVQMSGTIEDFRQKESEAQYLNNTLHQSVVRVQGLEEEVEHLQNTIQYLQLFVNYTRQCEQKDFLQRIKGQVQAFSHSGDWDQLKSGLDAALDHSSETYQQLQDVDSVFRAGAKDYSQLVSLLLCAGLPVDTATKNNNTVLHGAALGGHLALVELLLQRGATVDARNYVNETTLFKAVQGGHLDVVKRLVQAGADTRARDKANHEAIFYARQYKNKEILEYLQQHPHTFYIYVD